MARKATKKTPNIYYNEAAKKNPYWFQVMVDGKRVTRRGFRTKGEAEIELAKIESSLHQGTYIEPAKMTYGSYFKEWLSNRDNIADSTRDMYDSYFRTHIEDSIGSVPLSKLTPLDIQRFNKEMRDKGLSDEMVKRVYSVINASLNAAVKMELITKNVADKVEKPKIKRRERSIWNNESIQHVLMKSRGETRYWIAIFLAVMTGMRQGEILGLKWIDVDFGKNQIYVRRNLKKDKSGFTDLKTEKSRRVIAISPLTRQVLDEQLSRISIEKDSLGSEYQDNELVVCTSKGTPAKATKVLHAWKVLCERYKPAHEPNITFHDLRHQSASIMLNEGVDIRVVSRRLGHSTVTTTLDVYSHLLPTAQEQAALSLDKSVGFNFGLNIIDDETD